MSGVHWLQGWAVVQSQCVGTRSDIACWHPSYRPLKKVVMFEPILRLCHAFRRPAIQSDRYIDISACALLDNRQRGFSLSAGVITQATFYLIIEQDPGDGLWASANHSTETGACYMMMANAMLPGHQRQGLAANKQGILE